MRQQKLQRAASSALGNDENFVLEDCEDVGNRAASLRTAAADGLLHIHEIKAPSARPRMAARRRSASHSGQKWLRISVHSSAAECVAALRAAGCESILAAETGRGQTIRRARSTHAARHSQQIGGAEAEADDAARKAAVDA